MKNDDKKALRQQLIELIKGGGAHAKYEEVVAGIPAALRGQKPAGLPHSPWMLLEHLRIAQRDILEFSRNPKYVSPDWPADYWPKSPVSAYCLGMEREHRKLSQRLEVDAGSGRESEDGSFRPHSLG